jgi:hypothetical protein
MDSEQKAFAKDTVQSSLDASTAFLELLKEIPMGDTTLGDYVMSAPVIEENKLYPIVAAGTDAERLLMEYHSLYSVLLYDVLSLTGEELEKALLELEADVEPLSVYHGVQNDLVSGTIGVTGDAEMYSNSSGKSFFGIYTNDETQVRSIAFTVMGAAGFASMIGGVGYLAAKSAALNTTNQLTRETLRKAIDTAKATVNDYNTRLTEALKIYKDHTYKPPIVDSLRTNLTNSKKELISAESAINKSSSYAHLSTGQIFLGGTLILAGAVMMGVSIWQLTELYNKYEVSYTDIPDNMVDVVSYDEGDRFVNYKNVPAYYFDAKGVLQTRENDLNAYAGRQWVSLYYTKNYEAGYCLTASPDLIAKEAGKTGYSPVHLFCRTDNYNVNSYCNRENAEAVYLAFKYSTNQKSAVTDVPEIIGSIFSVGTIAISAIVGFACGAVLTSLVNKKKQKHQS